MKLALNTDFKYNSFWIGLFRSFKNDKNVLKKSFLHKLFEVKMRILQILFYLNGSNGSFRIKFGT